MRRLLLGLLPLLLLARLFSPSPKPDLYWLDGCWHDPDNESTRLIWTRTADQGALGLLTCGRQTTLLAIASDGRLTLRELGPGLEDTRPLRRQPLLGQGAQELNYRQVCLRYQKSRTDKGELQIKLDHASFRLQRD